MSAYRSTDPNVSTGPCRVFRVAPTTGRYTAQFAMPADCGHAGGLAYLRDGSLVVSDTRRLYKIDVQRAFRDGHTQNALQSAIRLGGDLKGSFAAFDGTDLRIGSSEDEASKARLHRVSLKLFDEFNGRGTVRKDRALSVLAIGVDGQGATVDRQGNLWLTFSSRRGVLQKVDPSPAQSPRATTWSSASRTSRSTMKAASGPCLKPAPGYGCGGRRCSRSSSRWTCQGSDDAVSAPLRPSCRGACHRTIYGSHTSHRWAMEKTTLYLPAELAERLRQLAKRSRRPAAAIAREAVQRYISA